MSFRWIIGAAIFLTFLFLSPRTPKFYAAANFGMATWGLGILFGMATWGLGILFFSALRYRQNVRAVSVSPELVSSRIAKAFLKADVCGVINKKPLMIRIC